MVRMRGLEPPHLAAPDPKSGVYTNFTTSAHVIVRVLIVTADIIANKWYAQKDSNLWPMP